RTPAELSAMIDRVEDSMKARLADLRSALTDRRDLREILMGLFPKGLEFSPTRVNDGERAVWKMKGPAVYKVFARPAEPVPVQSELRPQRDSNPCYRRERPVS